ncbi:MAG: ABC-2 family transporter protein [Methanomassiliicoccales archaeon PtaU1.Bin124]|nr:MAG: ABC-2 family transporter protein [Methanomassiliicoccales archaeon PtaU1.Bin124]
MGLDPIGYRPWNGKRTQHERRLFIISERIVREKFKSTPLLALFVMGMLLVHFFPLVMYAMWPHAQLTAENMSSYMQGGIFFIFNVLLVSIVCSDLISEDMRSSSIVLYLSRALRPEHYLLGKWLGAMVVICLFTLVPPVAVGLAITATQSGPDYLASLGVVGQTAISGLWTALFLVPVGMLMSALTSKRTYAGVGTFMFFFIMTVISSILQPFSPDWGLLSPQIVLNDTYAVIFGMHLPANTNFALLALMVLVLTVPPMWYVYDRIMRKGVGK